MDTATRDAFLNAPRVAVISTVRKHGGIHSVPVWYRWDGEDFRVFTGRDSPKHRNAVRTGQATICVDQREHGYRYVTAECSVSVEETVTLDQEIDLWTFYMGDAGRKMMEEYGSKPEANVCLVLRPDRWIAPDRV